MAVTDKDRITCRIYRTIKKEEINPLIGQLLWHRNIRTEEALRKFLHPTIEDIYDPFLMHDMESGSPHPASRRSG